MEGGAENVRPSERRRIFDFSESDAIGCRRALLTITDEKNNNNNNTIAFSKPKINTSYLVGFSHRCGLTNEDLNRKWSMPDPKKHPEIFHARVNIIKHNKKDLSRY